jgi:phage tail-like protein
MDRKILFALLGTSVFVLAMSAVVIAPGTTKPKPLPASNFIVEIDGITIASFAAVEGLGSNMEVIEYREGNEPNEVRFLPGNSRVQPMTLVRGIDGSSELWDWYKETRDDSLSPRSMSVVILDHGREEKMRYNFQGCWPSAYNVEPLDSNPSNVAYEKLVVQCDVMSIA